MPVTGAVRERLRPAAHVAHRAAGDRGWFNTQHPTRIHKPLYRISGVCTCELPNTRSAQCAIRDAPGYYGTGDRAILA